MSHLAHSVMTGVTDSGFAIVTQNHNLSVDVPGEHQERLSLVEALVNGFTDELPGLDYENTTRLTDALNQIGALEESAATLSHVTTLSEAIRLYMKGAPLRGLIATADELLVLPTDLTRLDEQRVLRAFIAAISPHERLLAYSYQVMSKQQTVFGDRPTYIDESQAVIRLNDLDRSLIYVVNFAGEVHSISRSEVLTGWEMSGRLRPVWRDWATDAGQLQEMDVHIHLSEYSCPNLLFAKSHDEAMCRGVAKTPEEARIKALAEAMERFMSGEVEHRTLPRAKETDLPDRSCHGNDLVSYSTRQYESGPHVPYNKHEEYLWTLGQRRDGQSCWVPAELAYFPFNDPERESTLSFANSSGVAAHTDRTEAIDRAARELVERDAYMWTWVQKVARERISLRSLPSPCQEWVRGLKQMGYETDFVNLTLETHPVILCAVHNDDSLMLGAACNPDPTAAAVKALEEAGFLLWDGSPQQCGELAPKEVVSTDDHQKLYIGSPFVNQAAFLYSSTEIIECGDIPVAGDTTIDAVSSVAEPVVVDLTGPAAGSLSVVRVLAPGLIPISFGYDREPLGLPRLSSQIQTNDGRVLGRPLSLEHQPPLLPHPFA